MAEIINSNTRPGTDATVTNYTPDFNGVNSGITIPAQTGSNMRISFTLVLGSLPAPSNFFLLLDARVAGQTNNLNVFVGNTGLISYNTGGSSTNLGVASVGVPLDVTIDIDLTGLLGVSMIGERFTNTLNLDGQIYNLRLTDLDNPDNSRYYPLCLPSTSGAMAGTTTIRDNLGEDSENKEDLNTWTGANTGVVDSQADGTVTWTQTTASDVHGTTQNNITSFAAGTILKTSVIEDDVVISYYDSAFALIGKGTQQFVGQIPSDGIVRIYLGKTATGTFTATGIRMVETTDGLPSNFGNWVAKI